MKIKTKNYGIVVDVNQLSFLNPCEKQGIDFSETWTEYLIEGIISGAYFSVNYGIQKELRDEDIKQLWEAMGL
jgi:hypothetical protein